MFCIYFYNKVFSCAFYPDNDNYYYYNIFKQTNVSLKEYYPFLRDDINSFYNDNSSEADINGNLILWKELLTNWDTSLIKKALYTKLEGEFVKIKKKARSNTEIQSFKYIEFARKVSKSLDNNRKYTWKYSDIIAKHKIDIEDLLIEGLIKYKNENIKQLKLRYAFQIIKLYYYKEMYDEAIMFFEKQINSKFDKNEIYYYILDYIGGCYYSLKDYEKAAYIYLTVFTNSIDRKKSAFVSYRFCTDKNYEGKTYFKNINDTLSYIFIKALRPFSDRYSGIYNMIKLSPCDRRIEILFVRELNSIERKIWPADIGISYNDFPVITEEDRNNINQLANVAHNMTKISFSKNKDFWMLSESYLLFLKKNYTDAISKLDSVKETKYIPQKIQLKYIYEVFLWDCIDTKKEEYIAFLLGDILNNNDINCHYCKNDSLIWKYLILQKIGNLYYKNKEYAKAFLISNSISLVKNVFSIELIDDMINFVAKKNKTKFETMIIKASNDIECSILSFLFKVKGIYYLYQKDPHNALINFKKSESFKNYCDEKMLLKYIFSNNIEECFECPEEEIMSDNICFDDIFSFIKRSFSKKDLAEYLIKLEDMTKSHDPNKRFKANYLLGNYYFNISNTGYYRCVLMEQDWCTHYSFFGYNNNDDNNNNIMLPDKIKMNEGFNLSNLNSYKKYFGLEKIAYDYYQKAYDNTKDKELKAKCLYLQAKCELNSLYNEHSDYAYRYDGTINKITIAYKKSFKKLKINFESTEFYKYIIGECSFFRLYCSAY